MVNIVSQTMNQRNILNNTWKYVLVIGSKVYVTWKRKILHEVIGGHQAYIQRNKDLFIYEASISQLAKTTRR